ncbi:MAG: hypothetical protein A2V69_00885 [Candidatus Portnoybacteria bacterium RBG_13_40_8]|uniref:RanBP2-type domain-containing protein n=1 Tax=Candidatus Portnoybacteria bacterium RBG_13_40_8 TaxID=1801990 RepID=A0A1G2F3Q3_9BACT|nr:MAG: hypothetical protein A2V69_00885 [Candidatus Portnoybacteria bacterium RBG_13_40_8]OGZ35463.1 MAG: hypothetical protein A2V60_03440 [Candidatus Portnoybacteria bacterium RIFCSPHIGHO2_01_FULL_39_19]
MVEWRYKFGLSTKEEEMKKPEWILNYSKWICSCGRKNGQYNKRCRKCGKSRPELGRWGEFRREGR